MTCHAYLENGIVEYWKRHSLCTLCIVRHCFGDIPPILASRLAAELPTTPQGSVTPQDAQLMLELAAALHDLGKTLNAYQSQSAVLKGGRATYYGHEAVSAYLLAEYVLPALGWGPLGSDVRTLLTVVGALMHHHAMRGLADWWIRLIHPVEMRDRLSRLQRMAQLQAIQVDQGCHRAVAKVVDRVVQGAGNSVVSQLGNFSLHTADDLVRELTRWWTSAAQAVERLPRAYLLVVGPVVMADNLAAASGRQQGQQPAHGPAAGGQASRQIPDRLKPWARELAAAGCDIGQVIATRC